MMKLIKRLKSNKGMTLTELLVSIAMLSLLMLGISNAFLPMTRLQRNVLDFAEVNTLLDNIANPIIRDLSASAKPPVPICGVCVNCLNIDCEDPGPCGEPIPECNICDGIPNIACFKKPCADCPVCEASVCSLVTGIPNYLVLTINSRRDIIYRVDGNGMLQRSFRGNENPVYPANFYGEKRISFEWRAVPNPNLNAYILTITVFDRNDRVLGDRIYAINPLVLNQA